MINMARITVEIDPEALDAARAELGTKDVSATVNAVLHAVGRRRTLAAFDVRRDIDGTPADVEFNRRATDA